MPRPGGVVGPWQYDYQCNKRLVPRDYEVISFVHNANGSMRNDGEYATIPIAAVNARVFRNGVVTTAELGDLGYFQP